MYADGGRSNNSHLFRSVGVALARRPRRRRQRAVRAPCGGDPCGIARSNRRGSSGALVPLPLSTLAERARVAGAPGGHAGRRAPDEGRGKRALRDGTHGRRSEVDGVARTPEWTPRTRLRALARGVGERKTSGGEGIRTPGT